VAGTVAITFGSVATAIAAVVGSLLLLTFVMQGLTHKDGFSGVISDWSSSLMRFLGFFANFSENMTMMWQFMADNWQLIVIDFGMFFIDQMLMLPEILTGMDLSGQLRKAMLGDIEYQQQDWKTDIGMPDLKGGVEGMLDFLKPYLPEDVTKALDPAPNIDFKKFIGPGGPGEDGDGGWGRSGPVEAPGHAMVGSADHAVRMWKYEQSLRPDIAADAENDPVKKQVSLLTSIEKNTRKETPARGETVADAGITFAGMVPGV
jgi:hypothetical protein